MFLLLKDTRLFARFHSEPGEYIFFFKTYINIISHALSAQPAAWYLRFSCVVNISPIYWQLEGTVNLISILNNKVLWNQWVFTLLRWCNTK